MPNTITDFIESVRQHEQVGVSSSLASYLSAAAAIVYQPQQAVAAAAVPHYTPPTTCSNIPPTVANDPISETIKALATQMSLLTATV